MRSISAPRERGTRGPVGHPAPPYCTVFFAIALLLSSGVVGCSCGAPMGNRADSGSDSMPPNCGDQCLPAAPPGTPMGQICCERTSMCVDYNVNSMCMPGFTCPIANVTLDAMCAVSCSHCEERPPLAPGYLAQDLDFVITSTGAQFLSGYAPGNPPSMQLYGDLVYGTVPMGGVSMLSWEIVDGAPTTPITAAPSGWRHGVAAPGDDVGRWSSMAVNAAGTTFYVAYYDVTHHALKLAIGSHGMWHTQTVDGTGDAGRYASLVLTSTGAPAVAYLGYDAPNAMGQVHSQVRVAVAHSAMPAATTDWTISRIADAQSPCRPFLCGMGQRCLNPTAPMIATCVTPATTCTAMCTATQACVGGACVTAFPSPYIEDITPAHGLYTNLSVTSTGLALVYYDRTEGNLYGVQATGATWGTPFLIDGYGRHDPNTGDSGIGASLFIDRNDIWHITYVDGADEVLHYAEVQPGATPTVSLRQVVDNGSTSDGTMAFTDGRHIVGDDSSVVVLLSGEVRVAYQDATAERTMLARRAAGASVWTHSVLDSMKHNGFWVEQETNGTDSYVASWWIDRTAMTVTNGVHITHVP